MKNRIGALQTAIHCQDLAFIISKNNWHSFISICVTDELTEYENTSSLESSVIDQNTPNAQDFSAHFLAEKPIIDSVRWILILAILVQEDWVDRQWLTENTTRGSYIYSLLFDIAIDQCCMVLGIEETDINNLAKSFKTRVL